MPALIISDSDNIASLDDAVLADLCAGIFTVSLSPTIWIGTGYNSVIGASVKIVNPYGVTIKNYPTSGYDINPPMTGIVTVNIPTQANNYQYGTYSVSVQLTDSDGTIYTVTKPVKICAPNPVNKTVKYGSLSAILDGDCVSGKVTVMADTPPNYEGNESDSQVNAFTLEYPTSSGKDVLSTNIGSFSATLYEGVYKFNGTICAHYSLGDNVFANVNYKVKREKNIRCLLDEACVAERLASLQQQLTSDCTDTEKAATQSVIIEALCLLTVIRGLAKDGQDASDYIGELETILGCTCTCNCAEGAPIINNSPTGDFSIQGCNVTFETVDLTTVYTIENYTYITQVTENGGALTITYPTLDDCTQTQVITFNLDVVYSQIKAQGDGGTEYNFWASVINKSWNGLDLTCVATPPQWGAWTFTQRTQWILDRFCEAAICDSVISSATTSRDGADVNIDWTNTSDVYEVAVYMDDVFVGSVLNPTTGLTIEGAADGNSHIYKIVSKCSNGSIGGLLNGSFTYFGCPEIAPPTVSDSNVEDATCPYDLTALVGVLPAGITAEWHNLNNTNTSSLVPNPTAVTGGVYYVFGQNSDGCYSLATQVILTCSSDTACSAPQNLIVEPITGDFRVRFQSAAFPPPSNSYTVKRRLTADPDISGSYTTIGTPTWNAGAARWEILDTTGIDNTLYTYRAFSNCTSSAPYVDYIFANLTCPNNALTPTDTTMGYSFTGSGGGIDKYEVSIYEVDETTLIHTNTHTPAFSTPITGTFVYLTAGTVYAVKIKIFIGTYSKDCDFITSSTTGGGGGGDAAVTIENDTSNGTISSFAGISGFAPSTITPGNSATGTHTAFTGAISLFFSVGATATSTLRLFRNAILLQTMSRTAGQTTTATFTSFTYANTDVILIEWF